MRRDHDRAVGPDARRRPDRARAQGGAAENQRRDRLRREVHVSRRGARRRRRGRGGGAAMLLCAWPPSGGVWMRARGNFMREGRAGGWRTRGRRAAAATVEGVFFPLASIIKEKIVIFRLLRWWQRNQGGCGCFHETDLFNFFLQHNTRQAESPVKIRCKDRRI